MGEKLVGHVTHYYGQIGVAAVLLKDRLAVGDHILVVGRTSDFEQEVTSMEIEHQAVQEASAGQEIGLKVMARAREGDKIYRVS